MEATPEDAIIHRIRLLHGNAQLKELKAVKETTTLHVLSLRQHGLPSGLLVCRRGFLPWNIPARGGSSLKIIGSFTCAFDSGNRPIT